MAKTKVEENPTEWSIDELAELVREGEKLQTQLGNDVAALTQKVEVLTKDNTALKAELAAIAPTRSGLPNELVSGMTITKLHEQALVGAIIGKFLTSAPASMSRPVYREQAIDDILSFADLVFQRAKERYGKE